ncbi:MAG: hypothetical protein IPO88_23690 [Nannocystis sp.]|uniref:hypothetical protein n=1 Tax=Nannocystis sp. TaxID=1962667 RepID=UPI00242378D6|nr:hypothetical protein [Nannocystis sp.]MBK9756446.1 hypothetical protein [Nannocystis sp.]
MLGATDDRSSLLAALADACGATGFTALGDATVLATSHGPLTTHAGLNTRTGRAERGGPLCQRIFGAVVDHSCLCTKYRGHEHLGHRCEKCGVVVGPASVRGERFGHVALVVALRHPWLPDARVAQLLVLPPRLRLLPRERGDIAHDPDQQCREFIAVDARNMALPMLLMGGTQYEPYPERPAPAGLTALYAQLIARNETARAMWSRAPEVVREHETALLQASLDALFGPPTTAVNPRGRRLRDLLLAARERSDGPELAALLLAAGLRAESTS